MIVDANVLGMFLLQPRNEDIAPIYGWLQSGWGSIVYSTGGQFQREIDDRNRERLAGLVRAGRARQVLWDRVQPYETQFENIRSDDPHILALARAEGVRLLYTRDNRLRRDFTDGDILGGSIYRDQRDANLLTQDACTGE